MTRRDPTFKKQALREGVQEFKRAAILRAATDLFYEKGFQRTTVDEIAQAMSVTKAVVYWNFTSKLELLEEIVDRGTKLMSQCVSLMDKDHSPAQNLAKFSFHHSATILDRHKEVSLYLFEQRHLSDVIRRKANSQQKIAIDALVGVLKDGVTCGEFRVNDLELVAFDILSMDLMSFNWRSLYHVKNYSSERLSRHFAEQALRLAGYMGDFPFDNDELMINRAEPAAAISG